MVLFQEGLPSLPSILNPNPPPLGSNPLGQLQPLGPLFGGGDPNSNAEGVFVSPVRPTGPAEGPPAPRGPFSAPGAGGFPLVNTRPMMSPMNPTTLDLGKRQDFPEVPQMGAPPQLSRAGGADFSRARKFAEEGRPGPSDLSSTNVSNVLGGLARGAASVSATEAGSFAKALAAAGAGGEEGRGRALEEGRKQEGEARRYALERSVSGTAHGTVPGRACQRAATD